MEALPPSLVRSLLMRAVIVLVPLIAVQVAICATFLRRVGGRPWLRRGVMAFALVDAALIFCAIAVNAWLLGFYPQNAVWDAMTSTSDTAFVWLFSSGPAYLIYLACILVRRWMRGSLVKETSPERRNILQAAGKIAATAAIASPIAAMAYGILVGRLDFQIRELDFPVRNLPPDLEGKRVLHLSDIHLGTNLSERDLAWVIDASNNLKPHIAIMTGDLITAPKDPMETCIRQLARLRSDTGTLGCLGNHELYTGTEAMATQVSARFGIDFLRMENRQLRFGNAVLNFGGVDYQRSSSKPQYLLGAEKLIIPGATNILLSHSPDVFPVAARQGWDAMLSGHTHGGQVTMEIVEQTVNVARFITPFVAGEYRLGGAACYVTRGIGTIGIPARVGVPPEITLLRLRKA